MALKYPLCSNCFTDEGLRLDAQKIGRTLSRICPNCKTENGKKLNHKLLEILAYRFFVKGTLIKTKFGGAPRLQLNTKQKTSVKFSNWLLKDVALIENELKVGFFKYGPRLWMIGEIEPLKSLVKRTERAKIINRIVNEYPIETITPNTIFYRLRVNPTIPSNIYEYDSSPKPGKGRLDSKDLPILYCSQDLEVCIHECRITVEDELYIASLVPKKELRLLDLTEVLNEKETEFESLDIAVHMLFLAQNHSYKICREIAQAIEEAGYDGIIYTSYFSWYRTGVMPFQTIYGISLRRFPSYKQGAKSEIIRNIALFGYPLKENKIVVKCINRICFDKIIYDYHFGPVENSLT